MSVNCSLVTQPMQAKSKAQPSQAIVEVFCSHHLLVEITLN